MIRVNGRGNLGVFPGMMNPKGLLRYLKFSYILQEPLQGISFSTIFTVFLYGDDAAARFILYPASRNEMPVPNAVFVFINYKISYKTFCNCFYYLSS